MAKFNPNKPKELHGGCLSLFGLPFFLAGLGICWLYFSGYSDWWRARNWVEVPCRIESTELEESRGGDSDSYRSMATYRYEYHGRSYSGDRVSFGKGGDNIGNFQKAAHRELTSHLPGGSRAGKPFRCFVNPDKPEESVIYRTLRWPMQAFMAVFALTFPAVGAGLVVGGWIGSRHSKRKAALREGYPEEPWKWKAAWNQQVIPEANSVWKKLLLAYTCWSGLVILPLLLAMVAGGSFKEDNSAWLALIFPALWCLPAWFAWKRFRQGMIIGKAGFEPVERPARTGGTLSGAIVLEKPLPARADGVVEVLCEEKVTKSSGDSSTTTTERIWHEQMAVPQDAVMHDVSGFRIPVSFVLPSDAPESGKTEDSRTEHVWKLKFTVPGSGISREFEVPVFQGEGAPFEKPAGKHAAPSIGRKARADLPLALSARGILAEFDPAGTPVSIICPARRHGSLIAFLVIFNIIWTGALVMIFVKDAPLVFKIVWPLFSVLTFVWLLSLLLFHREVSLDAVGLRVRSRFGPLRWNLAMEKSRITGFTHDSNMSSNNQQFYRVRAVDITGKKITLADGITESVTAGALAERLEEWKGNS